MEQHDTKAAVKLVLAKFPDDGKWYKASVLKENEDSYNVRWVDYGGSNVLPKTDVVPSDEVRRSGVSVAISESLWELLQYRAVNRAVSTRTRAKVDRSEDSSGEVTVSGSVDQVLSAIRWLDSCKDFTSRTIRLEASKFGTIIGPKGATITKLQTETHTFIDVPGPEAADADGIVVIGTEANIDAAEAQIQKLTSKWERNIPVPTEQMGRVIGAKGQTIRQIEAETGAQIRSNTTSTGFIVSGTAEAVELAKTKILEIVNRVPQPSRNPAVDRNIDELQERIQRLNEELKAKEADREQSETMEIDAAQVGLVIGPKGATIQRLEKESNTRIRAPKTGGTLTIVGRPDGIARAKKAVTDLLLSSASTRRAAPVQQDGDEFWAYEVTDTPARKPEPRPSPPQPDNSELLHLKEEISRLRQRVEELQSANHLPEPAQHYEAEAEEQEEEEEEEEEFEAKPQDCPSKAPQPAPQAKPAPTVQPEAADRSFSAMKPATLPHAPTVQPQAPVALAAAVRGPAPVEPAPVVAPKGNSYASALLKNPDKQINLLAPQAKPVALKQQAPKVESQTDFPSLPTTSKPEQRKPKPSAPPAKLNFAAVAPIAPQHQQADRVLAKQPAPPTKVSKPAAKPTAKPAAATTTTPTPAPNGTPKPKAVAAAASVPVAKPAPAPAPAKPRAVAQPAPDLSSWPTPAVAKAAAKPAPPQAAQSEGGKKKKFVKIAPTWLGYTVSGAHMNQGDIETL